jgi:hypothetical protein
VTGRDLVMRGTYRPCLTCRAPIISPPPDDAEIELINEGPPEGPVRTYITPHYAGCTAPIADPQPGAAIRLPAATVLSLTFGPPPVQRSPIRTNLSGFTFCGTVAEGWAVSDMEAGQMVQNVDLGDGELFLKPVVRSNFEGSTVVEDCTHDSEAQGSP